MKNLINRYTDHILNISFYITVVGVSLSLLLTSCSPVSQSVNKNKPGGDASDTSSSTTPQNPFPNPNLILRGGQNSSQNKSGTLLENKSFIPMIISADETSLLPEAIFTLDKSHISQLKKNGSSNLTNEFLEKAEVIYIVFEVGLKKEKAADLNASLNSYFNPLLVRTDENKFQLSLNNELLNNDTSIKRKSTAWSIKTNLKNVYIYTNQNESDDIKEVVLASTLNEDQVIERKTQVTSLPSTTSELPKKD